MKTILDPNSISDYRKFLKIKSLPTYTIRGCIATYSDEYASVIDGVAPESGGLKNAYHPSDFLFDYQRDISRIAIAKEKYAVFADCGLGKTLIYFEFARHAINADGGGCLILTPLMVVPQIAEEYQRFYGQTIDIVTAANMPEWLASCAGRIGVSNYEALGRVTGRGQLSALILDESSILKSHYGKWGQDAIELGKGLRWKLCGTGTPAPNDRIEYANHAVFLDRFPTVNSFLAKYFVNKGQTQERWSLRPHALKPFYRSLSDWSIFLSHPGTYGWKDNCEGIPPVEVIIHDLDMTDSQRRAVEKATGGLFAVQAGGITSRSAFSRIAKGLDGSATVKYDFIRELVSTWPDKSTIVWCWYNDEQTRLEHQFPNAASIRGATPHEKRLTLIEDFKSRRRTELISKPKVLGFGLNLQVATRQVFSSLIDSYEQYYQAYKRSNRIGSTETLQIHIPVLDVEIPMVDNVLRKAANVQKDTAEQEAIFKEYARDMQWIF